LQHSPSQIYIRGFHPVTRYTNIILDFEWIKDVICCTKQARWMAKSKVVPAYQLEHTNKELDGRLTSLLLLARFFSSAPCCFVTACTFQTFSSTPSLALLLLPLDVFAWLTSILPCLTCVHDIPTKQGLGCPPMLVLCMWFDKRCWRGIPWCIMVHVWLG
jgi:hypothetical protein